MEVDWGGMLFLQRALQFAGQCQLCSKGGNDVLLNVGNYPE